MVWGCAILREMGSKGAFSRRMAHKLQHLGLDGFAVLLLEGFRPLTILAEQLSYMASPFFSSMGLPMNDIGQALGDPEQVEDFLNRLKEPEISE